MPRLRVILLDKDRNDPRTYQYALWADVPAARRPFYARPAGTVSEWNGALAADNAKLVTGEMVERTDSLTVGEGVGVQQVQAMLQDAWTNFQAAINSRNPWARYGTTWDGTTWVSGGVA